MPSLIFLHGGRIGYMSALSVEETWAAMANAKGRGLPVLASAEDGSARVVWPSDVEDVKDCIDLRTG